MLGKASLSGVVYACHSHHPLTSCTEPDKAMPGNQKGSEDMSWQMGKQPRKGKSRTLNSLRFSVKVSLLN